MLKQIREANKHASPFSKPIAALKAAFPGCFTKAGAFDIERFKEEIGREAAVTDEGYRLDFLGKSYARLLAATRTETLIAPDAEHNAKPENAASGNLYITGDNLDALKHLRESYAGRIKCVYIDPPYNTGSDDFAYNDTFKFSTEDLVEKLNLTPKQAERLAAFSKSGSASHSAWLTFMLPRLVLARDLMSDDGTIFISIDDNEQAELKLLCDSIFGEENFVAEVVWEGAYKNDADKIGVSHEYVITYSKAELEHVPWSIKKTDGDLVLDEIKRLQEKYGTDYDAASEDLAGWYRANKAKSVFAHRRFRYIDARGAYKEDDPTAPGGRHFELKNPLTGETIPLRPNRGWGFDQDEFNRLVKDGRITFVTSTSVMVRRYFHETDVETPQSVIYQPARSASERLAKLMGGQVFPFPKDETIIKQFVEMSTDESSLVLDFFSGSGTTAEAVMRLNAEDQGNRKFILVQIPEKVKKGSEAEKAKFRTIDEIGRKRIELAAAKIREENPMFHGDVGYRHYTLVAEPAELVRKMDKFDPKKNDALFGPELEQKIGRDVILQTWFVHDGLGFTPKTVAVDFAGYPAVWAGDYLYLVDGGWTEKSTKALFERYSKDVGFSPTKVVLFGYAFDEWNVNTGLKDNLKHLQDTERCLGVTLDVRY